MGSKFVVAVSLLALALSMLGCSAADDCGGTLGCAEEGDTPIDGADASARAPLLMPHSNPFEEDRPCGTTSLVLSTKDITGLYCMVNPITPKVYKKYVLPGQASFQGWYKCVLP